MEVTSDNVLVLCLKTKEIAPFERLNSTKARWHKYLYGLDSKHVGVKKNRPLVAQPEAHKVLVVELKLSQP